MIMHDPAPPKRCPSLVAGRYELLAELGCGATGTVWEARDRQTGTLVAIKVLSETKLSSATARARFQRNAAATRDLRHPHIVEVLAQGQERDGSAYVVMERLAGRTLAAVLRDGGTLEQTRAIRVAAQILDAVSAAHQQNIVHRDLKPENVMLVARDGGDDFVKVCDFGLAKVFEPADEAVASRGAAGNAPIPADDTTEEGMICGTPAYMSPEQSRGEHLDGRADLYSIAVILYRALVGRPPFQGRSRMEVLSRQLSASPPPLGAVRPDLRIFPPLERLVLRALSKDPAERPCSAEVFRSDLLQIQRDYLRRAGPDGPGDQAGEWQVTETGSVARRRARLVPAALVGGAFAAAIGLWGMTRRFEASPVEARPVIQPATAPLIAPPVTSAAMKQELTAAPRLAPVRRNARAARIGRSPRHEPSPGQQPAEHSEAAPSELAVAEEMLANGAVPEACEQGKLAATRASRAPAVWEFLGRCYMRMSAPAQARAYYRQYLALEPETAKAPFIKAIVDRDTW